MKDTALKNYYQVLTDSFLVFFTFFLIQQLNF